MRLSVDINQKDLQEIRQRLREQMELLRNTATPMSRCAIILYQSVMANFTHQGTDKEKWAPLAPSTIIGRMMKTGRKKGATGRMMILQDRGTLRQSITPKATNDEAEVGTNLNYAKILHEGGTIPMRFVKPKKAKALSWIDPSTGEQRFSLGHWIDRTEIPARPFMVLREEHKGRIMQVLRSWFFEGV